MHTYNSMGVKNQYPHLNIVLITILRWEYIKVTPELKVD